jgi:uncharacterized protein (DUF2141 family)
MTILATIDHSQGCTMSNNRFTSIRSIVPATLVLALAPLISHAADLKITVEGVPNDQGNVMVGLFNKTNQFPKGQPLLGQMSVAQKGTITVTFSNVPPGRYAISSYHDANHNQKLDTNMMGMPTEAYGFSRDARGTMGPPKFEEAAIDVNDAPQALTIHLK